MSWTFVLALAACAYGLKLLGAVIIGQREMPLVVQRCLLLIPAALLAGLIAKDTFTSGQHYAIDARAAGLAVAVLATWRKLPFVVVIVAGMSTNGTVTPQLQVGNGSIVASGYLGSVSNFGTIATTGLISNGFRMDATGDQATSIWHGKWTLEHVGSNKWVCAGAFGRSNSIGTTLVAGSITLASNLDIIRLTINGTKNFDAGTVNIMWE
jgi:branched-subunit amino acid transport protein